MSRQHRKCSQQGGNGSRKKSCPGAKDGRPPSDIVLEKQHLAKLALQNTSCAGCIASVRALLGRPLSELRMLKGVVDEHGSSALRLKDAYVGDPKRTEQLLDAFPMSSVLKKVKPVGSAQRCQLHRRLYTPAGIGTPGCAGGSGHRGGEGVGGSGRGGQASIAEPWEWEDVWDRMPASLRAEVATIKAPALEAAIHHATDANRFCSDCKHNVVQAHDILMGKVDLDGCENEDEFDEEIFQPLEDRVFEGRGRSSEDKVLACDVDDVEDLIYFHEDFSSQDFDSSSAGGQQRHAATLEQGQREVRSVLGALLLTQIRSVWHAQAAQVQGEQYLFCLLVDAVRTMLASKSTAPHGDDIVAIDAEERCAAEERRQKRRQKRRDRKRAGKTQQQQQQQQGQCSASAGGGTRGGNAGAAEEASTGSRGQDRRTHPAACSSNGIAVLTTRTPTSTTTPTQPPSASSRTKIERTTSRATREHSATAVLSRRNSNAAAGSTSGHRRSNGHHESETEASGSWNGCCGGAAPGTGDKGTAEPDVKASSADARGRIKAAGLDSAPGARDQGLTLGSHGIFGAEGLAFQLGCSDDEDSDGDYDVDPDLIMEMERLKSSVRSRSDIDFLRKTLRQNYDRFISQGAGRVH